MEQRQTKYENKVAEILEYARTLDSEGERRQFTTSSVVRTSNIVKEMPAHTLAGTLQFEQEKREGVKVKPDEAVSEEFMRETNTFVKV